MEVGLQFIFQNTHEGMSDAEMFRKETQLAIFSATRVGFLHDGRMIAPVPIFMRLVLPAR